MPSDGLKRGVVRHVRRTGPLLWYLPSVLVCAAVSVASLDIEDARITVRGVPSYRWLIEWQPQSTVLFALAAVLAAASAAPWRRVRVAAVLVCLAALAGTAIGLPFDDRLHMGDAETYTASRGQFDAYFSPTTVRFEAHLSAVLLRWLDRWAHPARQQPHRVLAGPAERCVHLVAQLTASAPRKIVSPRLRAERRCSGIRLRSGEG